MAPSSRSTTTFTLKRGGTCSSSSLISASEPTAAAIDRQHKPFCFFDEEEAAGNTFALRLLESNDVLKRRVEFVAIQFVNVETFVEKQSEHLHTTESRAGVK